MIAEPTATISPVATSRLRPQSRLRIVGFSALLSVVAGGCWRADPPATHPARIVSGSMAEQYWGEHWKVTCEDCGYTFRCGVEHPPQGMVAVCPNCGDPTVPIDDECRRPGKSVKVVQRDLTSEPPRRWELVAFADPQKASRTAVKRVLGLPGEQVAIRGGEIYIDGKLLRKSLAQLRSCAQLVNDDAYRRADDSRRRLPGWNPRDRASAWQITDDGYRLALNARDDIESPGRLPFVFGRSRPPNYEGSLSPIYDVYGYNQGLNRQLNSVTDVLLACDLLLRDESQLAIDLHDGWAAWQVVIHPRLNELQLLHGEKVVAAVPTSAPLVGDWFALEVAVCDRRLLAGINGQQDLTHILPEQNSPAEPSASAVSLHAQGNPVEVRHLRVFRDIYHLNPHYRQEDWKMDAPLCEDAYFLLGDNSPNSVDSRHYGAIHRNAIVGSVQIREE